LTWLDPNIGDGFTAIRYLDRSSTDASLDGQGWSEPGNKLSSARWYATAQTMPDGTVFVASGSLNGLDPTVLSNNNPTYEILSPEGITVSSIVEGKGTILIASIYSKETVSRWIFWSRTSPTICIHSSTS
jgi:hypothetical protein